MRALGARVCKGFGHFPELWIDRAKYLAQVQAFTKEIDCLNGQLGAFSSVPKEPVQFDPNGTRQQQQLQQQQMQQQCQRQQLEQQLEQKQRWLNGYLYSRAPYDAATLDPQLKALNAEKAALVYRLRMLECEGHAVPGLSKLLQLL
jgi:cytochrome c556